MTQLSVMHLGLLNTRFVSHHIYLTGITIASILRHHLNTHSCTCEHVKVATV